MSFIKLSEVGGSTMFVNPDHIVTMVRSNRATYLRLADEQEIGVNETPEEISELTATAFETDSALGYSDLSQLKEVFEAYRESRILILPSPSAATSHSVCHDCGGPADASICASCLMQRGA